MAAWADAAGAVAVGPLIYGQYGRLERSWETRDSVIGDIARHLAFRFERRRRPPPKPLEVAWLTGACLLVRRDVFEAAGGFDERFFLYYEDADLCRRLRASEGRLFVHPGFAVQHQRGASARQGAVQVQAAYRSSQLEYVSRYRHAWQVALVRRQVAALATRWERSRGGVEVREGAAALRAALARTAEPR
jgi:GT2 family glycosyltransferase